MNYLIRRSTPRDGNALVEIWRSSVAATHSFVSEDDLACIDLEVRQSLPEASVWLALDDHERPIAFMGADQDRIDSLFVSGEHRGRGVGRTLVEYAMQRSRSITTEVNEQNDQAVGFYRHLGFSVHGRSPTDEAGRPYPLLHMKWVCA